MSKLLIVTLVDGRVIDVPIDNIVLDLLRTNKVDLKTPIDHPAFAGIAHSICVNGMSDPLARSEKLYTHIPPSQIKSVALDFDYQLPQMTVDNGKQ